MNHINKEFFSYLPPPPSGTPPPKRRRIKIVSLDHLIHYHPVINTFSSSLYTSILKIPVSLLHISSISGEIYFVIWRSFYYSFSKKSGKYCKIYTLYTVYQYNNIVYISSRKRNRNKINILSDSRFFAFHLVSSLALGRIQSAFQSSFPIIDLLSEECRSVFH